MEQLVVIVAKWVGSERTAAWLFAGVVALLTFIMVSAFSAVAAVMFDPVRGRAKALVESEATKANSLWEKLGAMMAPYVLPQAGEKSEALRRRLVHAGFRSDAALVNYYAVNTLLVFGLPVLTLVGLFLAKGSLSQILLWTAWAVLIGAWLPKRWLRWATERRKRRLFVAMPDALDLLVVCTEAGYGLKQAIQRVADELEESHPELAAELGLVNAEMRAGVDRVEALRHLAERTDLEEIGGLVALLAQSLRFGTSVADSLRLYADEFRDKRAQRAEETAATISTRLVFPLVTCMFPAFFLVAIGPAVIGVMGALGKL